MGNTLLMRQLSPAFPADALPLLLRSHLVVPHTDADGLAAGAIALRAREEKAGDAILLERGQTPFGSQSLPPQRPVAILDWGIRAFPGPALFVDHHFPEAAASPEQIVVSGYGLEPEVSTAVLVGRMVPNAPAWLMAVGAVGDLGDRAWLLPDLEGVPKTNVRKLVPLINAPRRVPQGPVEVALAVLMENEDARAALADPRIPVLQAAREGWKGAFSTALRVAPAVSDGVAVIRFSSPYQVHPLVAQAWSRRLAPAVVIAANSGYLPGMVNFSVRGGNGDLRALLQEALPDQGGEFAHGHDRATGGSLPPEVFERLIRELARR